MSKFHGLFSIGLVLAAFALAAFSIFSVSVTMGLIYAGMLMVGFLIIMYAYCAKCSCREGKCMHVFPGMIAKILPKRKPGPYHSLDYVGLILPFIILVGFALPYLLENMIYFLTFLVLLVIGVSEIYFFVCTVCENMECVLNRRRQDE